MTSLRYGFLIGFGLPSAILVIVLAVMAIRWLLKRRVAPPAAPAAGAAAPAAVVVGVYATYVAWIFTRKTLWVLLSIAAIIALLWGLSLYNWDPKALGQDVISVQWQDTSVVLLVGVLAVFGLGLYQADKKDLRAMALMTCIILVTCVVYELYRHNTIGVGAHLWLVYGVCIALGLMVNKHLVTDRQKVVAGVLLGACFTMAGLYQFGLTWEQVYERVTSRNESATQVQLGVSLPATLGITPVELNPGGLYKISVHELDPSQCVSAYTPNNRYLGSDCEGDVDQKDVYAANWASARGDRVPVTYVLYPRP